MERRPVPDAGLPDQGFSHHAPIWWGSTLMLTIEGAGLAILIVTYFYPAELRCLAAAENSSPGAGSFDAGRRDSRRERSSDVVRGEARAAA